MLARLCLLLSLLVLSLLVAARSPALATPYEIFLDVETEQDLYDALSVRQIDGDTFERLRDLLARGVDLDVASRQELYELPNLSYADVDAILAYRGADRDGDRGDRRLGDGSALVGAGVLDELSYRAIAPFVLARGASSSSSSSSSVGWESVAAWAQAQLRAAPQDRGVVPVGLRLRAFGFGKWSAGAALAVTRLRLDEVTYDADRQGLRAAVPSTRLAVPKLYLRREDGGSALLLGSYRAGFGQRLVFDDTGAEQPFGFVFDDQLLVSGGLTKACKLAGGEQGSSCEQPARYATPDLRWRDGLFGAAASLKQLALGGGQLSLHAWASYADRAVYQYELIDRARCPDPRRDDDASCDALAVWVSGDEEARHAYQTLPSTFREALLGVHASYGAGRRDHVGLTGYLARTDDLVAGVALGAQESSRFPIGQRFGAVGVEAAVGLGELDLSAEVAHSFDELPRAAGLSSGGGLGAVARLAWSRAREEEGPVEDDEADAESESGSESGSSYAPTSTTAFELIARYYQPTFINPYARPVAAPDELEGQRARDEAGLRARASWTQPRLALRASLDLSSPASHLTPRLASELRAEARASPRLLVGAAASFDLACEASSSAASDVERDAASCAERAFSSRLRTTLQLTPSFQLTAQAQHDLLSASEQRLTLWLIARRAALTGPRARLHLRYRDEGTRTLASSGELRFALGEAQNLSLHLSATLALDPPVTSELPNPVLSLGATYDVAL